MSRRGKQASRGWGVGHLCALEELAPFIMGGHEELLSPVCARMFKRLVCVAFSSPGQLKRSIRDFSFTDS